MMDLQMLYSLLQGRRFVLQYLNQEESIEKSLRGTLQNSRGCQQVTDRVQSSQKLPKLSD